MSSSKRRRSRRQADDEDEVSSSSAQRRKRADASASPTRTKHVIKEYYADSSAQLTHTSTLIPKRGAFVRSSPRRSSRWRLLPDWPSLRSWPGAVSWLSRFLSSLFLPAGYPQSVTPDYLSFQLYDTVQATSSYLRGILCTQAILAGYGVGNSEATAASATLNAIVRDGVGMFGGMLFAWWGASSFGVAVKQWRLFADLINDLGLTLELLSPLFPRYFLLLACIGTLCRALCGVAAGATRAALMSHFALQGNIADISAKEGIQETAVTLIGLVAGWQSVHLLDDNQTLTWAVFVLLTVLHMYANVAAMRCLVLPSLDNNRAHLCIDTFLRDRQLITPEQAATQESLAPSLLNAHGQSGVVLGARAPEHALMQDEVDLARGFALVLLDGGKRVGVLLERHATAKQMLSALFHAKLLLQEHRREPDEEEDESGGGGMESLLEQCYDEGAVMFDLFWSELRDKGWKRDELRLNPQPWRYDLSSK